MSGRIGHGREGEKERGRIENETKKKNTKDGRLETISPDLNNKHKNNAQVLRPKIDLLKREAGLSDPAKLGAVLAAQPRALLAASLERHLAPTVAFFTSSSSAEGAGVGGLGMRKSTLARIASKRPILLTYDKEEQIAPKVKFFTELGLTVPQIRGMVAASPDVLSIGIGNDLQPTVVSFCFCLFLFCFSSFRIWVFFASVFWIDWSLRWKRGKRVRWG